jgi:N utilization substance protein A
LAGEHIDVVRYSNDPQVLIPNALQPAAVEQVLLCDLIGRAIVLVQEDQLSLAIGRRGQNVRLASKLCGWDIEIMTSAELEEKMDVAIAGFSAIPGVTEELAQGLVEQGYLSFDDLSVIEPDVLMEMSGLTAEQIDEIVEQAEGRAADAEEAAAEERRQRRDRERQLQSEPEVVTPSVEPGVEAEAAEAVVDEPAAVAGSPADVDGSPASAEVSSPEEVDLPEAADASEEGALRAESGSDGDGGVADAGTAADQVEDGAEATELSPKSP